MVQKVNEVYKPLFTEHPRYFILMGGRGAGRSTVASQFANAKLMAPEYFRCAIMRYVLGDIRNSIYREITDRAEENGILGQLDVSDGIMSVSYGANSINAVGFRKSSSDQKSKLKSLASYNYVIIEEADEIPEEDFMQLDDSLRTIKGNIMVILLLNPPAKNHWIVKRWFKLLPAPVPEFYIPQLKSDLSDTIFIHTDYHSNESNIAHASIVQYEAYKETKPQHYWNMIRGYIPETVKGKIYNNWNVIDSIPHEAKLKRYGLDFGYSNDPTAIVAIYYYNGGYILDEVVFQKGLSNKQIADILGNLEKVVSVADSAEPKSIDEIASYGILIIPSQKGPGSVNQGIQYVQDQKISVTARSKHILEEYDNYSWDVDKEGEVINDPKPGWDHSMDAIRYGLDSFRPMTTPTFTPDPGGVLGYLPGIG